jgi:hypothetical protein
MVPFTRTFKRAALRRQQRVQRKQAKKQFQSYGSKFILEPLEPRLFLSNDLAPRPAEVESNNALATTTSLSSTEDLSGAGLLLGHEVF